MKLLKGYYAYLAIAGGVLLRLVLPANWMVQVVAFALISAGALALQAVSRWFFRASIAADVCIVFAVVCGPAVIPPGLLRIVLEYAARLPLLALGCMLLLGYAAQRRHAGQGVLAEWIVLTVWSAGIILMLLLGIGLLNEVAFHLALTAANTLAALGHIALIVETFRAQREYLRTEEET